MPDPSHPKLRIFRTGDIMRLGPNGMLCFVGRADRQVNIHGVRIEPTEIEAVLRAEPAVADAAVVTDASGRLHAFVASTAAAPALRQALIARLRTSLPPAMRPLALRPLALRSPAAPCYCHGGDGGQ